MNYNISMIEKPDSIQVLGLEKSAKVLRGAKLSWLNKHPKLDCVFEEPLENVKPLYIENTPSSLNLDNQVLTVTALKSTETLVRQLEVKLKKEKDIEAVLSFQAEPILPFPPENAVLDRINLRKTTDGTQLTLLAARNNHLQNHLEEWKEFHVEPEVISCEQKALISFANVFIKDSEAYYIVHIDEDHFTCVLSRENKLIAAQTGGSTSLIQNADITSFRLELMRVLYGLAKQSKGQEIKDILLTGKEAKRFAGSLFTGFNQTIHEPTPTDTIPLESADLQKYAIALGNALSALPDSQDRINFRQKEFTYPNPWKRYIKPLAFYLAACAGLYVGLYAAGSAYLLHYEDSLKQEYVQLLATMNKPYDSFESEYLAKYPQEDLSGEGEIAPLITLSLEQLSNRLTFLQNDLQSTPNTFPLLPNVPKVSDVLAWLSTHQNVISKENDQTPSTSLIQLETFSYTMVKRPDLTKKQEKYQVRVEIEFSTTTPKIAREFHDALIAPNEIVDPKGEVKWSSNRGKYKTSFVLKDKTNYPFSAH